MAFINRPSALSVCVVNSQDNASLTDAQVGVCVYGVVRVRDGRDGSGIGVEGCVDVGASDRAVE